jgi:hypothetical protein
MKTVRLLTLDSAAEAHILQGRLDSEEIESFITNENSTNLLPYYNNMLGSGIQLFVREEDYEKARAILLDKIEPDTKNIICPYCGSVEISLGLGKHKLFNIFNILISLLFIIPAGNLKPKYFCKACKEEFN